jgi:hypothetical protein
MITFRSKLAALLVSSVGLANCSVPDNDSFIGVCDSSPGFRLSEEAAAFIERQSLDVAQTASRLRIEVASSSTSVGFIAKAKAHFLWTEAANLETRFGLLRLAMADTRSYEFAWHGEGTSILPKGSEAACSMLANSVAAFSVGNSQDHVVESLTLVEQHFTTKASIFRQIRESYR